MKGRAAIVGAIALLAMAACESPRFSEEPGLDPLGRALARTESDLFGATAIEGEGVEAARERYQDWDRRSAELEQHLIEIRRDDAALADLLEAARLRKSAENLWRHYEYARVLRAMDRLEESAAELEELVRDHPYCWIALRLQGEVAYQLGDMARARSAFQTEVEVRPESAPAHFRLAQILVQMRDVQEARQALERALELEPDLTDARALLSQVLVQEDDFFAAVRVLEEGLALDPDALALDRGLGALWLDSGFIEKAIVHLEKHPDDPGSLMLLAQAEMLSGDREGVLKAYEAMLSLPSSQDSPIDVQRIREEMRLVRSATDEQIAQNRVTGPGELVRILEETDEAIPRRQAAATLGKIPGSAARAYLRRALEGDRDDRVRRIALQSLVTGPEDLPLLESVLIGPGRDESAWVRKGACDLLSRIASPRSIPLLIQALNDEPEVFSAAREGLIRLSGERMAIGSGESMSDERRREVAAQWRAWWARVSGKPPRD
ncbi:MAG: tetratricopeptide repeat protein [Planctomycetota bacterium]